MIEKSCNECKESKSIDEFYKMSSSKDGYRPTCKVCEGKRKKKNVLIHRINSMAIGILQRTNYDIDKPQNKCYKDNNVKCLIGDSVKEIREFLLQNFRDDIEELISKDEIPTVDRIDSSGNYELSNIRILSLKENIKLGIASAINITSKPIKAIFPDGNEILYKSVSECSRELKLKRDTIIRHRDNNSSTRKGIRFQQI